MKVRTRIAPSPTGFPHIGTIYQTLFNWAYAEKYDGQFVVRIEDTDQARLVADAEEVIYKSLDWFGLSEDESPRKGGPCKPYKQSERLDFYKKQALELVEKGHAYYCRCSSQRLEELRKRRQSEGKPPIYDKHCIQVKNEKLNAKSEESCIIRLNIPRNQKIVVNDEIRGEIEFDSNLISDPVILKSDGYPTYHLASVVDDHLMEITHVVRGEEWISTAPIHFLLYQNFGWERPLFFHTPLLRNPDHSKLSKRHGHTNVDWYKKQGYLPEATLNFLALLGWSHPEGREVFTLDEFVSFFDLKDIKPAAPIFDLTKLEWLNGEYIREAKNDKLKAKILGFYKTFHNLNLPEAVVVKSVPLIRERIKKLSDYWPLCRFFFEKPKSFETDLSSQIKTIAVICAALEKIDSKQWKAEVIGEKMQETARELEMKNSEFFMILRTAVTGKKISPPLNESMEILGKDECLRRLSGRDF